jgi:uncharacterized phage protein (predicted DNA packaging)
MIKITDLDLVLVKQYLKIDYLDDDILLETMLTSAKSFIQNYLKKKFTDYAIDNEEIPDEFTIACLAIISHWYEKREVQGDKATGKELAYVFSGLLDMHRNWN